MTQARAAQHPVVAQLREVVGGAGVRAERAELAEYAVGAAPGAPALPVAVALPADTAQVVGCVEAVRRHGLRLVPRGGGTGLAGGAAVGDGDVVISTERMTRIETIDWRQRVAVVQAGVCNRDLSIAAAQAAGACAAGHCGRETEIGTLYFSPDPSSQRTCTLGGNAATNAGGIGAFKHGVTCQHILGLEAVLADGAVLQTRTGPLRDGIGADLPALWCGSEGTLGILTRLWCRLSPRPRHFRTLYAVFPSPAEACQTVTDTLAAGIVPTCMEVMDGPLIRLVEDEFHYDFPIDADALLLLEIDGIPQVLDEQLDHIITCAQANQASDVRHCADATRRMELWSARKRVFGALGRTGRTYCTQDACVPRARLPEAVRRLRQIAAGHGLVVRIMLHAGDGNLHPIFLYDPAKPEEIELVQHATEEVLAYCLSVGGTIAGEHGVGVEKVHLVPRMFNPATIGTFQRIKDTFDPDHAVNDGKLIPNGEDVASRCPPPAPNVPGGAM